MPVGLDRLKRPAHASMGPRPIGRGMIEHASPNVFSHCASMGPRPIGRGMSSVSVTCGLPSKLQWGRGRSAAECGRSGPICRARKWLQWGPRPIGRGMLTARGTAGPGRCAASMGPRPIGRGMAITSPPLQLYYPASMGPRPIGRGMRVNFARRRAVRKLQWGRGRSAAECRSGRRAACCLIELQWGRGRSAAEC